MTKKLVLADLFFNTEKGFEDYGMVTWGKERKINVNLVHTETLSAYDAFMNATKLGICRYDVTMIWGGLIPSIAARRYVLNLDDYVTPQKIAGFLPASMTYMDYRGSLYALPVVSNVMVFYYRTDLIKTPPATAEEFLELSRKFSRPPYLYGSVFSLARGPALVNKFLVWLYTNDGKLFDEDGKPAFNSREGVEALQFMVDLVKVSGSTPPALKYLDTLSELGYFASGKAAMAVNWSTIGQIIDPRSVVKDKWAIALIPGIKHTASLIGTDGYIVSPYTRYPEEAVELAKYMTMNYEVAKRRMFYGELPALKAVWKDPEIVAKRGPFLKVVQEQLKSSKVEFNHSELAREFTNPMVNEIQSALLRQKTPAQALDDAAAAVERILEIGIV